MSFSAWLWGSSQVDEAIEKATSELLPSGAEDIALNLEISDQIRSKGVAPKDAMRALKKRLNHRNPNVQLLALGLTDTCVKNGGDHFLVEIASREFIDNLVSILKMPELNDAVKQKLLRLVQNWAAAFDGKADLAYVGQTYKLLKSEGFTFPPPDFSAANSAMVDTRTAPEWIDSDVCLRCRTPFTFTNRKHHCRNCGQVFDQRCSSKSLPLPHFGIQQEVRVCDACYAKMTRPRFERDRRQQRRHSLPQHQRGLHTQAQAPNFSDEELQRAIQLSLQEVGAANGHEKSYRQSWYVPAQAEHRVHAEDPARWQASEPPLVASSKAAAPDATDSGRRKRVEEEEEDPDLRAAIEASLREANEPKPSAPTILAEEGAEVSHSYQSQSHYPASSSSATIVNATSTYDLQPLESDVILTFNQTVQDIEAKGGRDISRYPALNELYDKASGLRHKLALSLDDTDRKETMLSDMNDKLSQAVKLYDQLLTEQLSRPRRAALTQTGSSSFGHWNAAAHQQHVHARTQSLPVPHVPVSSSDTGANPAFAPLQQPQAQVQVSYGVPRGPMQAPPSGYVQTQHTGSLAASTQAQSFVHPPPASVPAQAQTQTTTYAPTPAPTIYGLSEPTSAPLAPLAPSAPPPVQYVALPPSSPQQFHQQQQPLVPGQLPHANAGVVNAAAPHVFSIPTPGPASASSAVSRQHQMYQAQGVPPPPMHMHQSQAQLPMQSQGQAAPFVHTQAQAQQPQPQPQLQPQTQPQPQSQSQAQPQIQMQSQLPPLSATQVQGQLQQLPRQESHLQQVPPPPPPPHQQHQHQQQSSSSSLTAYANSSSFPQFPSAPTTEPQYALYEASSRAPAATEHKEALLIDL